VRISAIALLAAGVSTFAATSGPVADARLVDAVKGGDRAAALALLTRRVNPNVPEPDGTTALDWAVRQNDSDLADRLIRAGADVKLVNRYGINALSIACLNGNAPMIAKLIAAGADTKAPGQDGETPLMTAARSGNVEAAKILLDHGADLEARESWHGETALMWAVAESHPDMVKELVARGADVNATSTLVKWERETTFEPREKWLPMGALTPLLFATRQGCTECARILVAKGANLNQADPDGVTPVISAIINGHYDTAGYLVEKGADPNLTDKTGRTALYAAVDMHTMPASNRPSPKDADSPMRSLDLIKALLAHGANVNAQLRTAQPYRTKLDRGDDTMLTTGTTPLLRAAKGGDVTVMALLLEKGADPKLATRAGINSLMAAAGVGTREEDTVGRHKTQAEIIAAIDLCLKAGTNVNAAENRGQTALHGAAQKGWDDVVQYLVDHGAKIDVKDAAGHTPLDAAMGRTGGLGFDNSTGDAHESTAALIRKLMAASTPQAAIPSK
jgi:ankyrin repeat protein